MTSRPGVALLAVLLVCASGCAKQNGTDVVAPAGSPADRDVVTGGPGRTGGLTGRGRMHFTYHLNDRWEYRVRVTIRTDDGSGPAETVSLESSALSRVSANGQTGGRTYWIVENLENVNTHSSFGATFHLRPDARGLFNHEPFALGGESAVVPIGAPANDQIAPGADPGEQTLLSFPLFVGAGWRVGGGLPDKRVVTGLERLHLPGGEFVAWRIDHSSPTLHAPDRLTLWYAEVGLVQMRERHVQELFDDQGFRRGQRVTDVEFVLLAFRPGA